ncbi:thap-type zinc finger [Holotrichia oblita]|uniref:Thap-type zinc finger n=1 Tax=Holotrichia oblita TaxID=644536 RepID=A0ACB9TTK1_HOLOL|nr:thap-type zinc finger [Holotrichia oblita]
MIVNQRLFPFPSGERREVWLSLLNRPDFNAHFRICEVHFSEKQFENGRQDGKRVLRPSAVPDFLRKHLDCGESSAKRICSKGDLFPRLSDVEIEGKTSR